MCLLRVLRHARRFHGSGAHLQSSSGRSKHDVLDDNLSVASLWASSVLWIAASFENGFASNIGSTMAQNTYGSEILTWDGDPIVRHGMQVVPLKDNERGFGTS